VDKLGGLVLTSHVDPDYAVFENVTVVEVGCHRLRDRCFADARDSVERYESVALDLHDDLLHSDLPANEVFDFHRFETKYWRWRKNGNLPVRVWSHFLALVPWLSQANELWGFVCQGPLWMQS
jgi:hypothetical protein